MPIPEKFKNKYDNSKYDRPFENISDEEYQAYNQYMFARQQYYQYVNYLNDRKKDGYGSNDNNTGPKNMDEEAGNLLKEISEKLLLYGNYLNQCMHRHGSDNENPEIQKQRLSLSNQINQDTNRSVNELNTLSSLDMANLPSYVSMHKQATETVIDAGNVKLETVGEATSSRMILRYVDENGNVQKGFFTKDVFPAELPKDKQPKFVDGYKMGKYESINQRNTAMSDVATLLGLDHILAKSTNMVVMINGVPVHGNFMANAQGFDEKDIKPNTSFFNGKEIKVDYNKTVRSCTDMMILDYICGNADRHPKNHFYKFEHDSNGNPQLVGFQGIDNDLSFTRIVPNIYSNMNHLSPLSKIKHISKDTCRRILNLSEETLIASLAHNDLDKETLDACINRLNLLKLYINGKKAVYDEEGKLQHVKLEDNEKIQIKDSFSKEDYDYYETGYVNDNDCFKTGANPINNFKYIKKQHYKDSTIKSTEQQRIKTVQNQLKKEVDQAKKTNTKIDEGKRFTELMNNLENQSRNLYLKNEQAEEIKKGVNALQHKLYMDVNVTLKAQAKQFNNQASRFWAPKDSDIESYKTMYNAITDLNEYLAKMAKEHRNKPLSDRYQNILALKYKDVEASITKYVTDISGPNMKRNDRKRVAIGNCLQKLCNAGRQQREFQIEEYNTLMTFAAKQCNEDNTALLTVCENLGFAKDEKQNYQIPENPDIRFKIAKARLDGISLISSYIGNIIPDDKVNKQNIRLSVASVLFTSHLAKLKQDNPEKYADTLKVLDEKPNSFSDTIVQFMKESNFSKLIDNIRPTQLVNPKIHNYLLDQAEKFNCFKDIDTKIEKNKAALQKAAKVKK